MSLDEGPQETKCRTGKDSNRIHADLEGTTLCGPSAVKSKEDIKASQQVRNSAHSNVHLLQLYLFIWQAVQYVVYKTLVHCTEQMSHLNNSNEDAMSALTQ